MDNPNFTEEIEDYSSYSEEYMRSYDEDSNSYEPDDRYDAPVLWIKKTFKVKKEDIIEKLHETFEEANIPDVEVLELYITTNKEKDHAYILLNSSEGSHLLLDGTITVIVETEDGEERNLWFEKADHLKPQEHQDPFVLYIWKLPRNSPAAQVAEELRLKICEWCPIIDIYVPQDDQGKGLCIGWAKITFQYEFDTQKCVYLLNYNYFMKKEIRAGFCNTDRIYKKKETKNKGRKSHSRDNAKSKIKTGNKQYKKSYKRDSQNNKGKRSNNWTIVQRK